MTLTLITAPANGGQTVAAVDRLSRLSPLELAASARYIVPTMEAARRVEAELMSRLGVSGLLGNVVCTFFSFAGEFIAREGLTSRLISDVKKELTLRKLIDAANPDYLGRSAQSPGFVRALDQIIGELKISLVDPEALRAATTAATGLPADSMQKLRELQDLYSRYQEDVLRANNLHDREGLMWRALEIAGGGALLKSRQIVVFDGFDRMNAVERRFLEATVRHVPEVIVTQTYEPGRPEIFGPVEETRNFLHSLGPVSATAADAGRPTGSPLTHLVANIWRDRPKSAEAANSVIIIEACDPAMEIEMAAEEILRLTATGQCDWSDILVTTRDLRSYQDRVVDIFSQQGIPLSEPRRPLAKTALATLLVACLNIIRDDWPRDEVIRVLKSELITKNLVTACRVELKAKERAIVGGHGQWLEPWGDDDKYLRFRRAVLKPVLDFAAAVRSARSLLAMTEAVRCLISGFKWRIHDDVALAEDAAAYQALMQVLMELEEAAPLVGPITSADFFNRLEEVIYLSDYQPANCPDDAVRLTPASGIGGERHKAVFVLGMLEKSFPRPPREEPFLRDAERRALNQTLKGALEPRAEFAADDERRLFYTTIAAAVERLYLSYPLSDQAGNESLPSFYLAEVGKVLEGVEYIRRDYAALAPAPESVFGVDSLKRSVVYALSRENTAGTAVAARAYNRLIETEPLLFATVFHDSAGRPARLTDRRILNYLGDAERRLRCTELEVYAACAFRHFCSYTLRLKAVREEIDALDSGSLLHDVLYRLFCELRAENGEHLALGRLDPNQVGERAQRLIEEQFQTEPRLINLPGYRRDLLLSDLKTSLAGYIRHEIAQALSGFTPAFFELEFGGPGISGQARDERSTSEPLRLGKAEREVKLAGKIDRVDTAAHGALVIDYKSGQTPNLTRYGEGLSFQPLLYALALKNLFGLAPVGAEYRPIRQWRPDGLYAQSAGVSGRIRGREIDDAAFDAALENCANLVLELAARLRAGRIEIEPRECPTGCEFSGVCRVSQRALLREAIAVDDPGEQL